MSLLNPENFRKTMLSLTANKPENPKRILDEYGEPIIVTPSPAEVQLEFFAYEQMGVVPYNLAPGAMENVEYCKVAVIPDQETVDYFKDQYLKRPEDF